MESSLQEAAANHHSYSLPTFDPATGEEVVRPKGHSRREFIRLALALAAGIGLAFSDFVASPFLRRAGADYFEVWTTSCHGYFDYYQTCEPGDSYFGSDNVGYLGFHRHNEVSYWSADGLQYKSLYQQYPATCDGRNAWIWNARNTMCSDGQKTVYRAAYGQWWEIWDSFSISRTQVG